MKILFVPIDNRPITYLLTKEIADVNKSLNLVMPKREALGGLFCQAKIYEILDWLKYENDPDLIILSLDTIAYGGLVPSRRCRETYEEIKERILLLKEILLSKKNKNPNLKIFATSSIMRISNNNVNEEEKEYWNLWGEKIFQYSYNFHKHQSEETDIPKEILEDYLQTRKRNFEINRLYIKFLEEKIFDYCVFSKDDTGEYGLNVLEGKRLEEEIKSKKLPAIIKTGADEIPLGLFTRGVAEKEEIKIKTIFHYPNSINKISRYEDLSVENCTKAQLSLALPKAKLQNSEYDLILYVNNFEGRQGDLVFQDVINHSENLDINFNSPFIIADINNANGADNGLIEAIFKKGFNSDFLSYSGYNTSANTIGSAICLGVVAYLAKKNNTFCEDALKRALVVRFLDDWGYQANERIKVQKSKEEFKNLIFSYYECKIKQFLNVDFKAKYSLPWERSFEIEVNLYGN